MTWSAHKDNLQESVLSFYHMVLGIKSRLPGLAISPISKQRLNTHSLTLEEAIQRMSLRLVCQLNVSEYTPSTPGRYVPLVQAVASNGFLNFSSTLTISSGRCKFPTELL